MQIRQGQPNSVAFFVCVAITLIIPLDSIPIYIIGGSAPGYRVEGDGYAIDSSKYKLLIISYLFEMVQKIHEKGFVKFGSLEFLPLLCTRFRA